MNSDLTAVASERHLGSLLQYEKNHFSSHFRKQKLLRVQTELYISYVGLQTARVYPAATGPSGADHLMANVVNADGAGTMIPELVRIYTLLDQQHTQAHVIPPVNPT